jgi:hypothetical protein
MAKLDARERRGFTRGFEAGMERGFTAGAETGARDPQPRRRVVERDARGQIVAVVDEPHRDA